MAYMALVLLLIFIAIMLLGIPVGFGMGALTVIAFELLGGDLSMIPQKMFAGIDTYTYVCILLFILSADIMSVGGITNAIVGFLRKAGRTHKRRPCARQCSCQYALCGTVRIGSGRRGWSRPNRDKDDDGRRL